jgi:hypothetical protein
MYPLRYLRVPQVEYHWSSRYTEISRPWRWKARPITISFCSTPFWYACAFLVQYECEVRTGVLSGSGWAASRSELWVCTLPPSTGCTRGPAPRQPRHEARDQGKPSNKKTAAFQEFVTCPPPLVSDWLHQIVACGGQSPYFIFIYLLFL